METWRETSVGLAVNWRAHGTLLNENCVFLQLRLGFSPSTAQWPLPGCGISYCPVKQWVIHPQLLSGWRRCKYSININTQWVLQPTTASIYSLYNILMAEYMYPFLFAYLCTCMFQQWKPCSCCDRQPTQCPWQRQPCNSHSESWGFWELYLCSQ